MSNPIAKNEHVPISSCRPYKVWARIYSGRKSDVVFVVLSKLMCLYKEKSRTAVSMQESQGRERDKEKKEEKKIK